MPEKNKLADEITPDSPITATTAIPEVIEGRDVNGKLTRKGMEQAIKDGGSVSLPGRPPITNVEDLPSAAELAKGDAAQEAAVAASLDAQIAALSQQRATLNVSR